MDLDAASYVAVSLDQMDIRFMWRKIFFQQDLRDNKYRNLLYGKYLCALKEMNDNNCTRIECKHSESLMELKVLDDDPFNWYKNLDLRRPNVRVNANSLQELCTIKITSNIHHYDWRNPDVLHIMWTMFNKLPRLMDICFMAGPPEFRTLYHVKSVFVQYLFRYFFPDVGKNDLPKFMRWYRIDMNPKLYCHACADSINQLRDGYEDPFRCADVYHIPLDDKCSLCTVVNIIKTRSQLVELSGHSTCLQEENSTPHTDDHCDSYTHYNPNDLNNYLPSCPFNGRGLVIVQTRSTNDL